MSAGCYNRVGPPSLKATPMTDVTRILSAIEQGDPSAAEQLLPLVYEELRKPVTIFFGIVEAGHSLMCPAAVRLYVPTNTVDGKRTL